MSADWRAEGSRSRARSPARLTVGDESGNLLEPAAAALAKRCCEVDGRPEVADAERAGEPPAEQQQEREGRLERHARDATFLRPREQRQDEIGAAFDLAAGHVRDRDVIDVPL